MSGLELIYWLTKTVPWPVITAYVILPHTPLLELDQGQVIGSTLEWQSLVDSLSYRYCLLLSLFI